MTQKNKVPPDFTEFSKNMDKIMPNSEKKSQKSQQTKKSTNAIGPDRKFCPMTQFTYFLQFFSHFFIGICQRSTP